MPSAALQNPYQQTYTYAPNPNIDPSPFAFPQQHAQFKADPQQLSPTNPRKRRASELGGPSLPGSSGSNASAYGHPQGLVTGSNELDIGLGPSQGLTSPVAKKGRTNTPWTPAEEQRLKTLRDAGSSWSEIAKTFPTRTEGSVKKHWYKVRLLSAAALEPWADR